MSGGSTVNCVCVRRVSPGDVNNETAISSISYATTVNKKKMTELCHVCNKCGGCSVLCKSSRQGKTCEKDE